jgi:hypothetical protein
MRPDIERLRVEVDGPVDPQRLVAALRARLAGRTSAAGDVPDGTEHHVADAVARAVHARATAAPGGGSPWA